MRFGHTIIETRPKSRVVSIGQIPIGVSGIETSSWLACSTASARTMIVDTSDKSSEAMTIAVMGATGSGKTTFINLASRSRFRIGQGLRSCTEVVQLSDPFELDGKTIRLIDTPGFDDTTRSEMEILGAVAEFLASSYEQGKKLAGVIYMHRISDVRMGGVSTRNFRMFKKLCGEETLKIVTIITNMWSQVNQETGEERENELALDDRFFKGALERGAVMVRYNGTRESALEILTRVVAIANRKEGVVLEVQREMVDQGKDVSKTGAAEEVDRDIKAQMRKCRNEMRALQEEMKEAIRIKDEDRKREVESKALALRDEMSRVRVDAEKRVSTYSEEMHSLEEHTRAVEESSRMDAQRASEEYKQMVGNLQNRLRQVSLDSAREREDLIRQIEELRRTRRESSGCVCM